jgi:hypothetical protein
VVVEDMAVAVDGVVAVAVEEVVVAVSLIVAKMARGSMIRATLSASSARSMDTMPTSVLMKARSKKKLIISRKLSMNLWCC